MAKIKPLNLRELDVNELQQQLTNDRANLQKMRFDHAVGMLDDANRLKQVRKKIARVLTEMRARQS